MRKLVFVMACFFLFPIIVAGQDYPDFGMPEKEEIDMKECPFEKEAAAVVLMHEAFSYSEDDIKLITTHHVRIKILKQAGSKVANIFIPYYRENDFEKITQLEAITLNIEADGTITKQKVSKNLIFNTKMDERFGGISFAFPSVKAGSIIEYQYKSTMKNYWGLRDWYFQQDMPVMISRYHLKMIPGKSFTYRINKKDALEATVSPEPGKIFFEMKNVPAIEEEPYMDCKLDNTQRVNLRISGYNSRWGSNVQLMFQSSWAWVNTGLLLRESFGTQILADISGTTDFIEQVKQLPSPEQKVVAIYDFVRNNMTWNNYYSLSSFTGVNNAWQKRTGNSGDINLILINLLNNADLNVYPLLVSERSNGKVDSTYPYIDQFNAVFACVILDDTKYFLDATDRHTAAGIVPEKILNTTGFLIDRIKGELIYIAADSTEHKEDIQFKMQVTPDGVLKGKATIRSFDYAKIKKEQYYDDNMENFKEKYFKNENPSLLFDSFQIQNIKNDSLPLVQEFQFSTTLNGTGQYKYVSLNLFSGFNKNPFISDNRFSDINFGYKKSVIINGTIEIPANYMVDGLPGAVTQALKENEIVFVRNTSFNKANNTVYFSIKINFNKSIFPESEYPLLKDMYKKIFNFLDEKLVLKSR